MISNGIIKASNMESIDIIEYKARNKKLEEANR